MHELADVACDEDQLTAIAAMLRSRPKLVVLSGAGLSSEAGIPDYRDANGAWKRSVPVQFAEFMRSAKVRARYWARSMAGWPVLAAASPARGHLSLAALERAGRLAVTITQNVDDLHRRAGSRRLIDLHGRIARVRCTGCGRRTSRAHLQRLIASLNPGFAPNAAAAAPDGDAEVDTAANADFRVPACARCGGVLKPDVTFYGETIPRDRNRAADAAVAAADALLVVGSSLMVFSAYRLVRAASRRGIPVLAINLGRTRADAYFDVGVAAPAGETLQRLAATLAGV